MSARTKSAPAKSGKPSAVPAELPREIAPDDLLLRFARARLYELKASDRACLMHLLEAGCLTEHLVERGRSAALHYRRLLTRNIRPEDAEKEVTEQWVSASNDDEAPDPLRAGRACEVPAFDAPQVDADGSHDQPVGRCGRQEAQKQGAHGVHHVPQLLQDLRAVRPGPDEL